MVGGADTLVLYHGSREPLDELEANDPGYSGSLGYGLYLTTDQSFAEIFGPWIHETVSPVPDERVAYIEPNLFDCGPITIYTPSSSAFWFEMNGHRYSVLGDCAQTVRHQLRAKAARDERQRAALNRIAAKALDNVLTSERDLDSYELESEVTDLLDEALDAGELSEEEASSIERESTAQLDALLEVAEAAVDDWIGIELDLEEISREMEGLGYSAFFIDGYAQGNEYVIFDEAYLPLPVLDRWRSG